MKPLVRHYLKLAPVVIAFALGCVACGNSQGGNSKPEVFYVATSTGSQAQIMSFNIDASTGALSPSTSVETSAFGPYQIVQMKIDPSNSSLYASEFGSGKVRAFSVSASNGALVELSGSPFGSPQTSGNGGPIAITPNGKFLFLTDSWGHIAALSLTSGALTPTGTGVTDDNQPFDFAVDPTSKFLLVANHSDVSGNSFSVFSIDSTTGSLVSVPGSPFTFQANTAPYTIAAHPSGDFVYSAVLGGIEGLRLDRSTGALTRIPGSPFLGGARYLALHPTGKFLYATTPPFGGAGVGVIAFTVNSSTGALTEIAASPYYVPSPGQLIVDPSGHFLYVSPSTEVSVLPQYRNIAAYKIDQSTGTLSPVPGSPFAAADSPNSIAVVQLH